MMEVSALTVDPVTGLPAVLLEPVAADSRGFPMIISIGMSEASAIATELDGIEFERPCTHQLMCSLLADVGARVERIEIHDMTNGCFHVRIRLLLPNGNYITRDSRASDALALALHTGAQIEVAAKVAAQIRAEDDLDEEIAAQPGYASDHLWPAAETPWDGDGLDGHGLDSDAVDGHGRNSGATDGARTDGARTDSNRWDGDSSETATDVSRGSLVCSDLSEVSDEAFGKWKM